MAFEKCVGGFQSSATSQKSTATAGMNLHLYLHVYVFPECREEQFPCTRLYSVHKPVKQCINYLCITSVRRMYIINKEVCSRIVCKEDEAMQDEICRQLAGLPPRRFRRSGQHRRLPCRSAKDKMLKSSDAL
uniref:Microfibril associated protein 5 n=1 Tax=Sphenodon punctatus TaxID=8508 RepID=A0A8D0GVA6_SPHPU